MSSQQTATYTVTARNVGGIDEAAVTFEPGITVLAGRNATNRTSLLRALMGALGSERASLKAGTQEGSVELEIGGETYHRRFERRNGTIVTGGDPYLTDSDEVDVAELFAFLLESNEVRRAVAREGDLHDLLMRPIDTVAIEAEIDELVAEREAIDEDLAELDELADRLPGLETRRHDLEEERDDLEATLAGKREALEKADESVAARREEQSELDERMNELEAARSELTRTRQQLRTERNSVGSLEAELEDLREAREDLPDAPEAAVDVDSELRDLRDRQDGLDSDLTELQSVIQFNEKMLEGASSSVADALHDGEQSPADELLPDEERNIVCWTCGSDVARSQLEKTLETIRDVRSEKLEERSAVRDRIDELEDLKREQREHRSERRRLDRRIEETEAEIEEREDRIEGLEDDLADSEERVDELEAAVRDLQSDEQDELLELNREVNELEFELEQVRNDLEDVTTEIDRIEDRLADREDLEAEREALGDRLEDLRTRIERTEADAVEQFNDHMERVLDVLDYANLDRVWIERKQQAGDSEFDLHVIRSTADGAAFEDTIDHLSESEREVVGLVFALAGYLVHDVHETVPFLLLDSLEALDSERIASLVEYFGEHADSLVVALLPEDAQAVEAADQRIREF